MKHLALRGALISALSCKYNATNYLTHYCLLLNIGAAGGRFCDPGHGRDSPKSFTLLCFDTS
jgi:hypothetical protein